MKTQLRFEFSEDQPKFSLCIDFEDLTLADINQLMDRAELPIGGHIGATLISDGVLPSIEVICMYLANLSGGNPDDTLRRVRAHVFQVAALKAAVASAPEDQRDALNKQILDLLDR